MKDLTIKKLFQRAHLSTVQFLAQIHFKTL